MMRVYHNPATGQTATIGSQKADAHGQIWVKIDGQPPVKVDYHEFISTFTQIGELKS